MATQSNNPITFIWDNSVAFTWDAVKAACGGVGVYHIVIDGTPSGIPFTSWGYVAVHIDSNGYGTCEAVDEYNEHYISRQLSSTSTTITWRGKDSYTLGICGLPFYIERRGNWCYTSFAEGTSRAALADSTRLDILRTDLTPLGLAKLLVSNGNWNTGVINIQTDAQIFYYGSAIPTGSYVEITNGVYPVDN
jgi:hypothetical protein